MHPPYCVQSGISARSASRTAVLADPEDVLSLETLTDTVTVNGRTSSSVYDAPARTLTATSPAGRTVTTTFDALGRPLSTTG